MSGTLYVGLLRAVNVGGTGKVTMSELRDVLHEIGLGDVQTLLQSGNVVFRSPRRSQIALERALETATNESFGVKTEYFVRSADEWHALVADNPFPGQARRDPARLAAIVFKGEPASADCEALRAAIIGPETFNVAGRHGYFYYPEGMGRSRLTPALIERTLRTRGTARNWNTVLKLAALVN